MNKLEFFSLTDCYVQFSETIGVVLFSVRFSSFGAFKIIGSMGKDVFMSNKRKNNATFKGKQRDKENK